MTENDNNALYNWEEIRQAYGENKGRPYTIDKDARLRLPNRAIGKDVKIYVYIVMIEITNIFGRFL